MTCRCSPFILRLPKGVYAARGADVWQCLSFLRTVRARRAASPRPVLVRHPRRRALFTIMGPFATRLSAPIRTRRSHRRLARWQGQHVRRIRGGKSGWRTVFGSESNGDAGGYTGYEPLAIEIAKFMKTGNRQLTPRPLRSTRSWKPPTKQTSRRCAGESFGSSPPPRNRRRSWFRVRPNAAARIITIRRFGFAVGGVERSKQATSRWPWWIAAMSLKHSIARSFAAILGNDAALYWPL